MKKYCKKCKKEVETDNLFCPFCKSLTYSQKQKLQKHQFSSTRCRGSGTGVFCPDCSAEMRGPINGRYGWYFKCPVCGRNRSARHVWHYGEKMGAFDKFDDALDKMLSPWKRGCYITTAVCSQLHLPDNCYELKILRKFRDDYILKTDYGKKLIEEYYQISPKIVEKINAETDSEKMYKELLNNFITPSIKHIETGENKKAMNKYIEMMIYLRQKYN